MTAKVVRADRYQAAAQATRRWNPRIGLGQPVLPIMGASLPAAWRCLIPVIPALDATARVSKRFHTVGALTTVEDGAYCPAEFPMVPLVPFRIGRPATPPRSY
jgi:hypothetical protein